MFRCSAEVFEYFRVRLGSLRKVLFCVLLLDDKHRKLREARISEGSLTATLSVLCYRAFRRYGWL